MTKDPVCGMSVDKEKAAKSGYKEKVYCFCCSACKEAFDKEPEKYLRRK